jgi:hypothetical protein
MSMREHRTQQIYVGAVSLAGLSALVAAVVFGNSSSDPAFVLGLIAAGALSERFKVNLFGGSHISLSALACMAAALTGGARDGVIVAVVLALAVNLGGSVPAYKTCFNVATYVLSTLAFLLTYGLITGGFSWSFGPWLVVPLTCGALAHFAVNTSLVAGAIAIASGSSPFKVMRRQFLWLVPQYLPMGVLLFASEAGYASTGAWSLLVLAAPVLGIQAGMLLYANLKRAYDTKVQDVEERIRRVEAELAQVRRAELGGGGHAAA